MIRTDTALHITQQNCAQLQEWAELIAEASRYALRWASVWPGLQCMVDCELWVCSRVTRNDGEVHKVLYIPLLILL